MQQRLSYQAPGAFQGLQRAYFASPASFLHKTSSPSASLDTKEQDKSTSGPPTSPEELNSEKKVKMGVNAPSSASEFASEAKSASVGIAQSIKDSINVTVTAIKRSLGWMSDEKPMSKPEIHGAAGKMQHAPLRGNLPPGGPAASRQHAEAKYKEMMDAAKPHFPHGERSVNETFPDTAEAAKLQNLGGKKKVE